MSHTATNAELFLNQLRTRTADAHKALEALPISRALVSNALDRLSYTMYLQAMHSAIAAVENNVYPLLYQLIPDLDRRKKLPLLQDDLKVLGAAGDSPEPAFEAAARQAEPYKLLGIMYVIEGSTLGGRVIVKNVTSVLGFDVGNGANYFAGYGSATGPLWKSFLETLVEHGSVNSAGEDIIAGAQFAFRTIYNILEKKTLALDENKGHRQQGDRQPGEL